MCENARTGLSSAALRYLQLIEQNEENGAANLESLTSDIDANLKGGEDQDESLTTSFSNPFAENKQENSFNDELSRNNKKRPENSLMNSFNNPFGERHENVQESNFFNNPFTENFDDKQNDSHMQPFDNFFSDNVQNPVQIESFTNILDSTDILIDDSDICFKPETVHMSFTYSQDDDQNSILIPTSSAKSLEFGTNSSKSFPSPPNKRFCYDSRESFFSKSNTDQSPTSESFFNQAGTKNSTASESFFNSARNNKSTDGMFDAQFFNKSCQSIYSVNDNIATDSLFRMSPSSSTQNEVSVRNSVFDSDLTIKNVMSKIDDLSKVEEFMDEDVSKENAALSTKRKVNTFYQAPHILNTAKIDEFYKKFNSINWKSDDSDVKIENLMEPSLDYIMYRLKCLKPLTTGRVDDTISCENEDAFNCDSINQGIDEIEDSFDKGNFICSTPEEPVNTNDTNPSQEDENDDNNTTKSFVINKQDENVWSAITHVSCSIPLNEQENSEPIFDITTIFEFTNFDGIPNEEDSKLNCLDDDTVRYELMLSILRDCNNPLDKTSAEVQENLKIAENRKAAIMSQIEMLIEALVTSLVKEDTMMIKLHRIKDWKDCKYESNVLSQKETAIKIKSLSFTNKNTERTFTIVVNLLGEIYKLLSQNITCTKRELYYRDAELMKSQVSVNKALDEICALLNVQCWELGILSTSKGLVAGDLRIVTDENEIIDYSTTNSVPQKPSGIKSMESNAEYVLVVEKDTVFTRLIEGNIMEKIGKKIILVTAKGYPDINTRVLLKRIEMELQKPIYIIVDADAFGIDIMCTYKFGSLQMVKFSEQLAISTMEWIGIHPTDIEKLDITRTQLTDADVKKVDELLVRPYINNHLKTELEHLKKRGLKAEIESIYHFSIDYFLHDYIPQKIAAIHGPIKDIIRGSDCFKENLFS